MPTYDFRLSAQAHVKSDFRITAGDMDLARRKMLEHLGDCLWSYEELADDQPIYVREVSEDGRVVEHDLDSLDPDYNPKQAVPVENVDWPMLKEQKQALLRAIGNREEAESEDAELLQGILHMIDGLQDYAVDHLGVAEDKVFNRSRESGE